MKTPAATVRVAPGQVGNSDVTQQTSYLISPRPARTPLSDDGLLAYARTICGVSSGPECLAPDVEREFIAAIRKLTRWLDQLAGKPAFGREAAEQYHQERGGNVVSYSQAAAASARREAPAVTLDAVIYSARELGFAAAMATQANRDRIRSMSPRQHKELTGRLQKLVDKGAIRP